MPQRKARKKGTKASQSLKLPGYAYTRKRKGLQLLLCQLQQQAEAATQHVETSKQREMVLLDLTLHQEQIISLVNQLLLAADQQLSAGPLTPGASSSMSHHEAADDTEAAVQTAAHLLQQQQQADQLPLLELHNQCMQHLHGAQHAQQQSQQQVQVEEDPPMAPASPAHSMSGMQQEGEEMEHQEHTEQRAGLLEQEQHQGESGLACPMRGVVHDPAGQQQQQQPFLPASSSYVGSLLQAAAVEQKLQQRVLSMTAADWSKFFTASFYKLLLLLELTARADATSCDQQMQQAVPAGGFAVAAGAPVAQHSGADCGSPDSENHQPQHQQQEQQQPEQQQEPCSSSLAMQWPAQHPGNADLASCVSGAPAGAGHNGSSRSQALSNMQQLEQLIDEWVTLSVLALILNPLPLYMATLINHATQLPCTAPQGHFDCVVRRMRLTKQQVRHIAVVVEEIGRLDKVVMAQGEQLARNAGCLSTLVLAAEAIGGMRAKGLTPNAPGGSAAAAAAAAGDQSSGGNTSSSTGHALAGGSDMSLVAPGPATVAGRSGSPGITAPVSEAAGAAAAPADRTHGFASAAAVAGTGRDEARDEAEDEAGAAEDLAEPAESLLQRNVGRLPLHGLLLLMFNCSTLTRLQLAKCIVASYPFMPMTAHISASAARLWHQHQQRQQQQQEQQEEQQQEEEEEQQQEEGQQQEEEEQRQQQQDSPDHKVAVHRSRPLCEDDADELCCEDGGLPQALHMQQLQVLQQRRALLDQQLQQWWQEWRGLGMGTP